MWLVRSVGSCQKLNFCQLNVSFALGLDKQCPKHAICRCQREGKRGIFYCLSTLFLSFFSLLLYTTSDFLSLGGLKFQLPHLMWEVSDRIKTPALSSPCFFCFRVEWKMPRTCNMSSSEGRTWLFYCLPTFLLSFSSLLVYTISDFLSLGGLKTFLNPVHVRREEYLNLLEKNYCFFRLKVKFATIMFGFFGLACGVDKKGVELIAMCRLEKEAGKENISGYTLVTTLHCYSRRSKFKYICSRCEEASSILLYKITELKYQKCEYQSSYVFF
jgi:hypothetical protein